MKRSMAWARDDGAGMEFADVAFDARRLRAVGVALGVAPAGYRLDYRLETTSGFVTRRFVAEARGDGWRRRLDLRRGPSGRWTSNGTRLPELDGALDVDLAFSPLTNTMPVLRHGLLRGGAPAEVLVAWVSLPDLRVRAARQRYAFVRTQSARSIVRFATASGDFTADLQFDADGLCLRYPGIGRRV